MLLERLKTLNFRLLEDFLLDFDAAATVLIGPNNAGKSNIVDAVVFLKDAALRPVHEIAWHKRQGFSRIVSRHQMTSQILVQLTFRDPGLGQAEYSVIISRDGLVDEKLRMTGFELHGTRRGPNQMHYEWPNSVTNTTPNTSLLAPDLPQVLPFREYLQSIVHVDPFRRVELQMPIDLTPMVDSTGTDLARVLHHHYTNDRERFDAYEDVVRKVIPEVEMIETPVMGGPAVTVSVRYSGDSEKYNLWQISSGVKDVLVLLAAIHFAASGSLVILEEPENHLHPASQKALCSVIKDASAKEQKQFVLTTHSETVLSQFDAKQVVFIDKQAARATPSRLSEADVYRVWQQLGIERNLLLQVLGRARQVVVILEGRNDQSALEPFWEYFELKDKVLAATSRGSGWREIVDSARALREALGRFRLPTAIFIVLDRDSEGADKRAYLDAQGFGSDESHVWSEKEIESYLLLMAKAISRITGKPLPEVEQVITLTPGQGKERLEQVMTTLSIKGTPYGVIVGNALAGGPQEIPPELLEVAQKIRTMLGLERM